MPAKKRGTKRTAAASASPQAHAQDLGVTFELAKRRDCTRARYDYIVSRLIRTEAASILQREDIARVNRWCNH